MKARAANLRIVVTTWTDPMFLTPERLIAAGIHSPTSTSRIEPGAVVTLVDELLDVEHPADGDGGVPGPGRDPVRPRVHEADPVAEGDAGVGVRATVGGQTTRERGEQQGQGERPDGRETHRDQA